MPNLDKRNEELNKKISKTDLPSAVTVLISDAKKSKRRVRLLAISIFLDILLTIGLAILSTQTHNLATKAESNRSALVRSCETTNDARANNKQLWDYLFALTPTDQPTPEQQKQIDEFKVFINKTFAPRDCNSIQ